MSLTTVARGVVNGLRISCGLFLVMIATSAAVQAGGPIPTAVPEIDPGSMSGALATLASGAFLLKGWCRRK
jgi:hypothetical protein